LYNRGRRAILTSELTFEAVETVKSKGKTEITSKINLEIMK